MTEVQTTTTAELSPLDQAKRHIKKLRNKRRDDLAPYLVHHCPVPLDQLDLTPEELAKVSELKVKVEQYKREAEERQRQQHAERKAMVEESASKAKQASADHILELDPAIFDALQAAGVCFVRLSFEPYNRGLQCDSRVVY